MSNECLPVKDWDKPRDGLFQIITDSWWIVDAEGNPQVHAKYNSPQCNRHESIARRIAKERPVKLIPVVYFPVKISDYVV